MTGFKLGDKMDLPNGDRFSLTSGTQHNGMGQTFSIWVEIVTLLALKPGAIRMFGKGLKC